MSERWRAKRAATFGSFVHFSAKYFAEPWPEVMEYRKPAAAFRPLAGVCLSTCSLKLPGEVFSESSVDCLQTTLLLSTSYQ
jgi:hypothetical protein